MDPFTDRLLTLFAKALQLEYTVEMMRKTVATAEHKRVRVDQMIGARIQYSSELIKIYVNTDCTGIIMGYLEMNVYIADRCINILGVPVNVFLSGWYTYEKIHRNYKNNILYKTDYYSSYRRMF